MSELYRPTIAILASGDGSTAEAVIHATQDGRLDAEVPLIICNKPPEEAGIFSRIKHLNQEYGLDIHAFHISGQTHPGGRQARGQTNEESAAICEAISSYRIHHVALMGYMRIIGGQLQEQYGWNPGMESIYQARMSNTHPGPLPMTANTRGKDASQRVLDLGLLQSAHTLHLVAEDVDAGPVIAAHPFDIDPDTDDATTIFQKAQLVEKAALPYALGAFLIEQSLYKTEVAAQVIRKTLGIDELPSFGPGGK